MMKKEELLTVSGGGANWALIGGVLVGILAFFGGFLDGLTRPLSCNK